MVEIAPAGGGLYRRGFGGDTFNTAWYARRLLPAGWTVAYGTCIGTDPVSDEMLSFMEGEGIDGSAVRREPARTVGLYMISLRDGERSFSYWRGQSAARTLADDPNWLDRIIAKRNVIHFSGITLAILPETGRRRLVEALGRARRQGALIAFDTNIRPRLWGGSEEARTGISLGAAVADVVLPSFDEETALFGDRCPEDTIRRYREAGAGRVLVKNGPGPLSLWQEDKGTSVHHPPLVSDVVDTTAAGDSFAAAVLAAIATGAGAEAALERAIALSARVIQAPGALVPGLFEEGSET